MPKWVLFLFCSNAVVNACARGEKETSTIERQRETGVVRGSPCIGLFSVFMHSNDSIET